MHNTNISENFQKLEHKKYFFVIYREGFLLRERSVNLVSSDRRMVGSSLSTLYRFSSNKETDESILLSD